MQIILSIELKRSKVFEGFKLLILNHYKWFIRIVNFKNLVFVAAKGIYYIREYKYW